MSRVRAAHVAFLASGVLVLGAVPLTGLLQAPDLPGIVLVASGGGASLVALGAPRLRSFRALTWLVVLMAVMVALHRRWHHIGEPHDWLEPLYVGTVVAYCALALAGVQRLMRPGAPESSTPS